MLRSLPIAVLSLLVAQVALGSPVGDMKTEKREAALARLTPGVRAYLETLDPVEYTLDESEVDFNDIEKRNKWTDQIVSNCAAGNYAVTYDDGPYKYHKDLSDKWAAADQQVTFFVNGYNYDCAYDDPYPAWLADSIKQGHQVASHTWSHPHLTNLSDDQIDQQVDLEETYLLKTLGVVPKYIRPPYGDVNGRVAKRLIQKHGYKIILWSDDSGDASGASVQSSENLYSTFKKGESHMILNHETIHTSDTKVAPFAINKFKSIDVKSQTVHQCIGGSGSPYKVQTAPKKRGPSWNCKNKPVPGDD